MGKKKSLEGRRGGKKKVLVSVKEKDTEFWRRGGKEGAGTEFQRENRIRWLPKKRKKEQDFPEKIPEPANNEKKEDLSV